MEKAIALADRVTGSAFRVTLDHVEIWRGFPNLLALQGQDGVAGVELLHDAIHKALAAGTMAPRREPQIWPHVSLLLDQ